MDSQSTPSLVGTWRLLSWIRAAADGGREPNWDEHPLGLLVYAADGTMSAQLYDSRRPPLGGPWDQVTAEAARTAFIGMASYYGRYSLDAQAGTVTHWVEGAMAPDMIGGTQVRGYRFLSPDRIELSVVNNSEGLSHPAGDVLVWERVHRQQQ
jgi:Lipocalin-like domain